MFNRLTLIVNILCQSWNLNLNYLYTHFFRNK